jgi:hypothetical protein
MRDAQLSTLYVRHPCLPGVTLQTADRADADALAAGLMLRSFRWRAATATLV